jgi:hypothetical protein
MRIVILNWSGGENDPFTHFSRLWQRRLLEAGHKAYIIPLDAAVLPTVVALHQQAPVDLAFCWQGVGSTLVPGGHTQTLWELLRIPLVCLHADHPTYQPANHQQSSPFLLHLYGELSFAKAANQLIARDWSALHGFYPNLFAMDEPHEEFTGDYFVLSKNIQDLAAIRAEWATRYESSVVVLLSAAASAIERAYLDGNLINHHQVILEHAPAPIREQIASGAPAEPASRFMADFTRELDRIHRIVAATFILDALPQVPIRVHGRGWEQFRARGNPLHEFLPADTVEQSGHHFRSQFGILDVAASNDALHDRTLRALRHGAGFLLSSNWKRGTQIRRDFPDLFFGGDADDLARKVAKVQADPAAHRACCTAFGERLCSYLPSTTSFLGRVEEQLVIRGLR